MFTFRSQAWTNEGDGEAVGCALCYCFLGLYGLIDAVWEFLDRSFDSLVILRSSYYLRLSEVREYAMIQQTIMSTNFLDNNDS